MTVLSIDTSANIASFCVTEDGAPLCQGQLEGAKSHSEGLLPMIETLCRLSHISMQDIDLFACVVGPGSFTGIRIGVSVLKGLAFSQNKPCMALSALDVLAQNFDGIPDVLLCPVMDARRGHYYNALYRNGEKLCDDRLIASDDLKRELAKQSSPVYLCGDGAAALYDAWRDLPCLRQAPASLQLPCGLSACHLAERQYQKGVAVCTDATIAPVYLRATQAERELCEKTGEKEIKQGWRLL